jgi:arylsulfatase
VITRPSATAGQTGFNHSARFLIPSGNLAEHPGQSHATAEVEVPQGGEGMIVIEGGRFGGYACNLLKGKPVFTYNAR